MQPAIIDQHVDRLVHSDSERSAIVAISRATMAYLTDLSKPTHLDEDGSEEAMLAIVIRVWLAAVVMTPYKLCAGLDVGQSDRMAQLRERRAQWMQETAFREAAHEMVEAFYASLIKEIDAYQEFWGDRHAKQLSLTTVPLDHVSREVDLALAAKAG